MGTEIVEVIILILGIGVLFLAIQSYSKLRGKQQTSAMWLVYLIALLVLYKSMNILALRWNMAKGMVIAEVFFLAALVAGVMIIRGWKK
ncbi:MAG: hypothetical protein WC595_02745 [Candidatus Nanoarchaeia archaeon]